MKKLSIGKIRGLQQIASPEGILIMCAMDHRGSMLTMLGGDDPKEAGYEAMVERKLELCSTLAPHASAVLLDPLYGAAQCISRGVLPGRTGLLVSSEASGYTGSREHRLTELLDGWSVEKIKRMGGSAVKILVYYRPDLKEMAQKQLKTINKVAEECLKYDLPFLVEPVTYPVGNETEHPEEFAKLKPELVIKTAQDITALPIDVLKAEFPADLRYQKDETELLKLCRQLDASSRVPWVILSAGVDFELFRKQVEIACQAGASGFLGGRAIWQEAMHIVDAPERLGYLSTVAVARLQQLAEIAKKYAVPWYKRFGLTAHELVEVAEKWYQEY